MTQFKFKAFQIQDYARAALHDGVILAHDKGLGKTLASYTWCLLKVGFEPVRPLVPKEPCLLVAPGDAHDQFTADGRNLLGIHTTAIDSQATFLRLASMNPNTGRRELPPGFYLTTYTALASNGIAPFPESKDHSAESMMAALNLTDRDIEEFYEARGDTWKEEYALMGITPDATLDKLDSHYRSQSRHAAEWRRRELASAYDVLCHLQRPDLPWLRNELIHRKQIEYSRGIGETRNGIKCLYSPSLADLCCESFAAVAVDEGVKMKGEETLIGLGLRQMRPRYRLVLSGTPIKNRLPDIFRLAHWATGHHDEPTARWPYAGATSDRDAFAEEFLLSERNLSKEKKSMGGRTSTKKRFVKLSPQVCNIHRLWKLFGPIIVRRLKKDIGEQLVGKHRHVIRVPMGSEQARVYRHHIEGEYVDCNGLPAIGAQLQALRVAAAAPHCDLLKYATQSSEASPLPHRSSTDYIPKFAVALSLIEQVMRRGEQIAIFSALVEPLETMARRLEAAGVPYIIAHGGHTPTRRRKLSAMFKKGPPPALASPSPRGERAGVRCGPLTDNAASPHIPVMLASGECMAEAHSWHLCNNVALLAYSWAFDKLSQAIDRCHRLNSVKDLNYWAILCEGTVDLKLESNLHDKSDTSDLVLDGRLLDDNPKEVSLAEILTSAQAEFNAETKTIDEATLELEWPALRERLRNAARDWQAGQGAAPAEPELIIPSFPPPIITPAAPLHAWAARLRQRRRLDAA